MGNSGAVPRILIRGGRVYDHEGDVHQPPQTDILIAGETIERLGQSLPAGDVTEIIDAAGKLVLPGFVNAHYHSHDVMAKGLFEEMPFDIWTLHSNPANYGPRSLEEVRLRTLIGAAESLRNGITTIQDFLTVEPQDEAIVDAVLSAYEEAGIRVVFAIAARDRAALDIAPFMPPDLPEAVRKRVAGSDRKARDELDFIAAQIKRLGLRPTPRQTWALAPSAPQRCSQQLLEGIAALSRAHDLPVFTHVYETRIQAAAARREGSVSSLLDVLAAAGLLTEKLGIVHGVWLTTDEIAQIAEAGSCVIHNPVSNLKLKSGVAPILDLHRAGVDIALGCDNYSCAETQNIFIAMRLLCLLPAVTDPAPGPISAAYALKAATLAGARAVGLSNAIGAIKPGMMADLIILDLNESAFVPFNSAARQIVFSESGRAVETVLVGGRPVVRGGKLVAIDEAALAVAVEKIAPAFRRDAQALADRNADLMAPLLSAGREAWKVPLGFERYISRGSS
ncbi:MAG TPA: amidohydrolase family protein [Xanthobacteraceae bacterium]|jgi:cytosine/adenosine deaminase-related metal-dependent hydrolase|nr:amidohydrolase family protein [Xanthobacteraceae bacterium]